MKTKSKSIYQILYGSLFIIILPIIISSWAFMLNKTVNWYVPEYNLFSYSLITTGLLLMFIAIAQIKIFGKGLPMNAFPPKYFVTNGVYSWFSHPIYLGAILFCFGSFWKMGSPSGLYIVSPIFSLMTISLVYGYENLAIKKIFTKDTETYEPLFALPKNKITFIKKSAMLKRILLPWLFFLMLISFNLKLERPIWEYILAYIPLFLLVISYNYIAKTPNQLHKATVIGTIMSIANLFLLILISKNEITLKQTILLNLFSLILGLSHSGFWLLLRNMSEFVANARKDYLFFDGRFRIISHFKYPFLSGIVVGFIVFIVTKSIFPALVITIFTLMGGALFAQTLWGSKKLLRPFGYYGGVLGGFLAVLICIFGFKISFEEIALAAILCAPFAQAISRFRCLEQGCCHGLEVNSKIAGIKVENDQSRVCMISGLKGKYLLPTQTYSILFNLLLGVTLFMFWYNEALPVMIIIGLYFILTGIERFTEDAYRGEVQTRQFFKINEPQFFALICLLLGIIFSSIPSTISPVTIPQIDIWVILSALLCGLIASFMMSMDFPKSNIRFSRLSG